MSAVSLLLTAPSIANPYVRFDSRGVSENERVYTFSAGNSNVEIGVGINNPGQTSGNIISRYNF